MLILVTPFSSFYFVENGRKGFKRACYFENVDAPNDDCITRKTPSNVKNHFCETCETDGCNFHFYLIEFIIFDKRLKNFYFSFSGNSASQYGPIVGLVILSATKLCTIAYGI